MARKYYAALIAIVLIGMLAVAGRILLPRRTVRGGKQIERPVTVLPIYVQAPNVQMLSIKLDGDETISRSRGIPHGPIFGDDSYRLDGMVVLSDRSIPIHTQTYRPRAVLHFGRQYFLLTTNYFNPSDFEWLVSDGHEAFAPIAVDKIPQEFWALKANDGSATCFYRTWLLQALAQSAPRAMVVKCFSSFATADSRFPYLAGWEDSIWASGQLVDFLRNYVAANKFTEFYADIRTLLFASRPGDDYQVIEFACRALLALDSDRAKGDICEYQAKVKQDAIPGDTRAITFQDHFKDIDCSKLTSQRDTLPPTQPTP